MNVTSKTTLADMWLDLTQVTQVTQLNELSSEDLDSLAMFAGGAVAALSIIKAASMENNGEASATFNRLVVEAEDFMLTMRKVLHEKKHTDSESKDRVSGMDSATTGTD